MRKGGEGEGRGEEGRGGIAYDSIHTSLYRLYVFRKLQNFRILIGGGDGTFGWVLSALQDCRDILVCPNPPSALLPLGTGV